VAATLRNNVALSRYELDLEGGLAFAIYRASPGIVTIVHTEVPAAMRGSGAGSAFVRQVLEEVRRQGLKVVPECGFVRAFMAKTPQFNDLLR
jgi:predicted GNAT family acetyltransferase